MPAGRRVAPVPVLEGRSDFTGIAVGTASTVAVSGAADGTGLGPPLASTTCPAALRTASRGSAVPDVVKVRHGC